MKTTVSRWVTNFINLFTPDFDIRSLGVSDKEVARQLHYY